VIEFEEPHVRSVNSELLCMVFGDDTKDLNKAIIDSFYISNTESHVSRDYYITSEEKEFPGKIFHKEQTTERDFKIGEDGIYFE